MCAIEVKVSELLTSQCSHMLTLIECRDFAAEKGNLHEILRESRYVMYNTKCYTPRNVQYDYTSNCKKIYSKIIMTGLTSLTEGQKESCKKM